ncbi:right-handed parallel beta-helix repeat-containing protein [Flavobacterium sp. NG2]|uniref:right-handed parallel beta-helix repeat-containing protein n=1 Tax=Flavobacterium sp. NG2 TaxID=3097547 RepID=UPI002A811D7A|nr:right-handed parallel beta-helix repeat-containing protein [Flavobacterium sp. NG2]WPR71394.1 right-handed parallel beta-helix repeat-containing protein [Flavobacterium sp. NG2]
MNHLFLKLMAVGLLFVSVQSSAKAVIEIKHQAGDMTTIVRNAIEKNTDKDLKIVFEKGKYLFLPDYAQNKYSYITNHGNGLKKIIFLLENYDSVEIEGNGAELIFHGQVAPFQIKNCKKVTAKNLTIDWDIPFLFQGEVTAVNKAEDWIEIKPFTKGFSWKLDGEQISFPDIDGFSFFEMGSTLAFDPKLKRVAHGAFDLRSRPRRVEKRPNGILRIYEKLKRYTPEVGNVLNSKGESEQNRYAPAFQTMNSQNILFEGITIHHALGMGFLFERSEDIVISKCGVFVRPGSDRVVSTIADATHFCNCKGDILIENCKFQHMLDDGTNVHGTYVEINKIIDTKTVVVELKHFEQLGFEFAGKGDEMWFIQQPSPDRASVNTVSSVNTINDRFIQIAFENNLPTNLKIGDNLENKTWNPVFTMRDCTINDHRARNVIIKTPLKIVIENNDFSSMMSAIQLRGDNYFWFESGAVNDVTIRNNRFVHCAYGGGEAAILYVTPRLGKIFDDTALFDRNIRFENNTIETFGNRIIWADRVDGLTITGNKITKTKEAKELYPEAPLFDLINCNNVEISKNTYTGDAKKTVVADEKSKKNLKVKGNKGF